MKEILCSRNGQNVPIDRIRLHLADLGEDKHFPDQLTYSFRTEPDQKTHKVSGFQGFVSVFRLKIYPTVEISIGVGIFPKTQMLIEKPSRI